VAAGIAGDRPRTGTSGGAGARAAAAVAGGCGRDSNPSLIPGSRIGCGDRVGPGGAAVGQHVAATAAVLAGREPGRWCGSGSTVRGCTCLSAVPGSSRCVRGSACSTWTPWWPRRRSGRTTADGLTRRPNHRWVAATARCRDHAPNPGRVQRASQAETRSGRPHTPPPPSWDGLQERVESIDQDPQVPGPGVWSEAPPAASPRRFASHAAVDGSGTTPRRPGTSLRG